MKVDAIKIDEDVVSCAAKRLKEQMAYSVRRYYIDTFFAEHVGVFQSRDAILDMGGVKTKKRGCFNVEKYGLSVRYLNHDPSTNPDYLADVAKVPVADASFDGVILSEVLMYVAEPIKVIREVQRILKPGGILLLCDPFNMNVTPRDCDYGRRTNNYYRTILSENGFCDISIEKQGAFFSVLLNMLRSWHAQAINADNFVGRIKRKVGGVILRKMIPLMFRWDQSTWCTENYVLSNYTTGYGIMCKKKESV